MKIESFNQNVSSLFYDEASKLLYFTDSKGRAKYSRVIYATEFWDKVTDILDQPLKSIDKWDPDVLIEYSVA